MKPQELAKQDAARARRMKAIEAVAVMGMNYKEAGEYSGLAHSTVSDLMHKPKVKEYIAQIQRQQAKKLNVSRERVMEGILDAIGDAKMLGEPASQIRGWEQIAKMQGYYAPERHVHELPEGTQDFIEAMQSLDSSEVARIAGQNNLIELTTDDYSEADDAR